MVKAVPLDGVGNVAGRHRAAVQRVAAGLVAGLRRRRCQVDVGSAAAWLFGQVLAALQGRRRGASISRASCLLLRVFYRNRCPLVIGGSIAGTSRRIKMTWRSMLSGKYIAALLHVKKLWMNA